MPPTRRAAGRPDRRPYPNQPLLVLPAGLPRRPPARRFSALTLVVLAVGTALALVVVGALVTTAVATGLVR